MKYFLATLIITITLPLVAQAEVRINEIAWMGVSGTNGQYGEWFELYNSGSESVSLSGWKLYKDGGAKLVYAFTGSIAPGQQYLVERTTASMLDPVPGKGDEKGAFNNNGFANTGEHLVLKDSIGDIVQTLEYSSGWPAGDSDTKNTMQYSTGTWITAIPTPGALNSATVAEASKRTDESTVQIRGDIGDVRTKEALEEIVPFLVRVKSDPGIDFYFPKTTYTGNIYDFSASVKLEYSDPTNGIFVWNMGDGTLIKNTDTTLVRHSYEYPGVYTVSLSYYPSERYGEPVLWSSQTVMVVVPDISIAAVSDRAMRIKNNLDTSIDMSHWVITTPRGSSALPDKTILAPSTTITVSMHSNELGPLVFATLSTINGLVVAQTGTVKDTTVKGVKIIASQGNYSQQKGGDTDTVLEAVILEEEESVPKQKHRTKTIVIGVVIIFVIAGALYLERLIGREEE